VQGSTLAITLLECPPFVAACWTTGLFVKYLCLEQIFCHGILTQNFKAPEEAKDSGVKKILIWTWRP